MKISQPVASSSIQEVVGLPVLRLGLRPFYLGGACFGVVAVALWLIALHGHPVSGRAPTMSGVIWHAHEMVFGFVAAIVVGFLLTAVRAWTSLDTLRGTALAALWLLWVAGRVLVWSGPEPLAAVVDSAFLPVAALVLLRVLITARNRHNIFLAMALGLFGGLNALFHWWAWHGRVDLSLRTAYAATGLVIMFVTVIAGRVVPMFTMNAIPGFSVKRWKIIERLAAPAVVLTFIADAAKAPSTLVVACAFGAAMVHGIRIAGWHSWRVGPRPLLWILHVAYAWIPVGLIMLALASVDVVPHSLAIHALTVGAIGCAIIAMITRTALGHTGRALVAGRSEIASYWLMIGAAFVRVIGPWLTGGAPDVWMDAAGACWCAALILYLIKYVPYLTAPRADGKAG
ncbi:NnrS family protein [Burkholderia sp. WSM2232]|uniref:NnrS family protein n=1 Tax=Burkholderia sp. WSM2232 TaxID=944436 RepID=UPI00041A6908|nr:NnrS family protein [Burkholderia sp. WSM2232]